MRDPQSTAAKHPETPFVSVVIPTFNRADKLGITIESLVNQDYDPERYEILVADNNSTDATKATVHAWKEKARVPVTYIFEERQGVHYARNTAFQHARGDILYYTDDDMIADASMLKEIVKPFAYDDRIGAVTGRVLPKWEIEPPQWIVELCSNSLLSLQTRPERLIISPQDCGVYSCHQAMRRDAFAKSGGINPENTAGEWIGDGEAGLSIKLRELGYWFEFTGEAVTYHMIPPGRMTQAYLNKRLANQGSCDSYGDYRRYNYASLRLLRCIFRHLYRASLSYVKYLGYRALGRVTWRLQRARASYHLSRARYDYRLLTDKDWRALVLRRDWLD